MLEEKVEPERVVHLYDTSNLSQTLCGAAFPRYTPTSGLMYFCQRCARIAVERGQVLEDKEGRDAVKTPKQIQRSRTNIVRQIDMAQDKLRALQAECPHPNVEKEHKSNTGNYDPTVDCYWIDLHCPDCDKRWREDQ